MKVGWHKMYKKSTYVTSCFDKKGNLLLYIPVDGKIYRIVNKIDEVKDILSNPNECNDIKLLEYLIQIGAIVDADFNEIEYVERKRDEMINKQDFLSLTIMPTEQCNFRCSYCYESFNKSKMTIEIIEKIKELVSNELTNYSGLYVNWFGGEPLLELDVICELSEYFLFLAKTLKKSYLASMTTNGSLLTLDVIKKLFRYNVTTYQITIDGDREVHDSQRKNKDGTGTYDTVMGNLINIMNGYRNPLLQFIVRLNISQTNIIFLSKTLKHVQTTLFNDKRINFYIRNIFDKEIENTNYNNDIIGALMSQRVDLRTLSYNINPYMSFMGKVCYAAYASSAVIGADGTIYKCTVALDSDWNQRGNVTSETKLSDCCIRISEFPNERCRACKIYPICFGITCIARKSCCHNPYARDHMEELVQVMAENDKICISTDL